MIMDKYSEFADAESLNTGGAGTYNIGDVIDLGEIGRDLGQGQPMYLVVTMDTAATSGGSATGVFQVVSDSTATPSTDGTATLHARTYAIPVATLVAGNRYVIPLPAHDPTYERYLGFQQVTAVAAFTAGKVNAFLTLDPIGWKPYPDASN